jgi:signal transduction histidine kinase
MHEWEDLRILLLAFLQNSALFIILAYLFGRTSDRFQIRNGFQWHALAALIFTSGAIISMQMPFEPVPGVKLDQRNMILLFAAPFGGPWAAIIAGVATACARLYVGGIGAEAGAGAAVTSAMLGMLFVGRLGELRTWQSAVLGAILLSLFNYPWVLLFSQDNVGAELTDNFAIPFLVLYILGAPVLSAILMVHERRLAQTRELAAARKQLEDVLEVSTDWFWENDAELRFTNLSSSFRNVFSLDPSHYLGKKRSELAADNQRTAAIAFEAMLMRKIPFSNVRYQFGGDGAGVQHISISGKPVFDEEGVFCGYRGSGRDITAAVRAQETVVDALNQAEAGNLAKARFLSHMSHELRTPLNAVLGFADMMRLQIRGDLGHPEYRNDAENIHRAGEHLLSLINDLLDLSRLEAGKQKPERARCDPGKVIDEALVMLDKPAREAGVHLTVADRWQGPAMLEERAFKQVVLNLVSNAVKFTAAGGQVTIELECLDEGTLQLVITDTGSGIPQSEIENVLRPFERSQVAQLMATEGTGLGLPISSALVQAHEGTLSIDSEVGKGTRIECLFPAAAINPSARSGGEKVA